MYSEGGQWAITEIRRTPLKKSWELPKFCKFFIANSQTINHFLSRKGKEDMGIPKVCDRFKYKNEIPPFITDFDIKISTKMKIPNFVTDFDIKRREFPFFFFLNNI